jgi:hypothetical protein
MSARRLPAGIYPVSIDPDGSCGTTPNHFTLCKTSDVSGGFRLSSVRNRSAITLLPSQLVMGLLVRSPLRGVATFIGRRLGNTLIHRSLVLADRFRQPTMARAP